MKQPKHDGITRRIIKLFVKCPKFYSRGDIRRILSLPPDADIGRRIRGIRDFYYKNEMLDYCRLKMSKTHYIYGMNSAQADSAMRWLR